MKSQIKYDMGRRRILICLFLLLIAFLYLNKDIYYISKWHMYVKIENANATTKFFLANQDGIWEIII